MLIVSLKKQVKKKLQKKNYNHLQETLQQNGKMLTAILGKNNSLCI